MELITVQAPDKQIKERLLRMLESFKKKGDHPWGYNAFE